MARLVQLQVLQARVLQRANMEASQLIAASELTQYINDSAAEFDDLCYLADQSSGRTSTLITVTSATDHYVLPGDFRSLLGVEYQFSAGAPPLWFDMRRCPFEERNRFNSRPLVLVPGTLPFRYYLESQGQGAAQVWYIVFAPYPAVGGGQVRVWYRPVSLAMVNPTDSIDGVNGLDEFIVVDAAIKCLQKEESDVSVLMARKAELVARIEAAARDHDASEPEKQSEVGEIQGYGGGSGDGW